MQCIHLQNIVETLNEVNPSLDLKLPSLLNTVWELINPAFGSLVIQDFRYHTF